MAVTQILSVYPKSILQLLNILRIRCHCWSMHSTVSSAQLKDLDDRIWMNQRRQLVSWRKKTEVRGPFRSRLDCVTARNACFTINSKYILAEGHVTGTTVRMFHTTAMTCRKKDEPSIVDDAQGKYIDSGESDEDVQGLRLDEDIVSTPNKQNENSFDNFEGASDDMEEIYDKQNNIKTNSGKFKLFEEGMQNIDPDSENELKTEPDMSVDVESSSNINIDSRTNMSSFESLEKTVGFGNRLNLSQKIQNFLSENDLPYNDSYTGHYVVCPKFGKMAMKRKKDEHKIYINSLSGNFKCNACGKTGEWNQLKDNIAQILVHRGKKGRKKALIEFECLHDEKASDTLVDFELEIQKVQEILNEARDVSTVETEEFENILSLFDWQGITKKTFRRYGVKYIHKDNKYSVYFPLLSPSKSLTGARVYTAVITEEEDVRLEKVFTIPKSSESEIFGWQTKPSPVNKNYYKKLVITSGEIQAMALSQDRETTATVIALHDNFLEEHVPVLEKFEKIYLWFGTDPKSLDMSKLVAKRLNEKRCSILRHVHEMPLECIQMEESIKRKLEMAQPLSHEAIHTFEHLRLEVYNEYYHHEHTTGVKWKRFYKLNDILKGFRQGELTVLTGPTGSGKTTFLSEYSLDLCMEGVKTLWGSFEISNVRLIKMMMRQLSGKNLVKHLDDFDGVSERFKELPMYFMAYHGEQSIETVLDTMCHAVYVHNIQHVILDNLQFMVGLNQFNEHIQNIFMKQDKIVSQFRKFATDHNCHVTLIIHPRKIDSGEELSISSIFGSAKVSQESDNIILIQDNRLTKPGGRKYLQITKNRFDGDLGVMTLTFDKESLSFTMNQKK